MDILLKSDRPQLGFLSTLQSEVSRAATLCIHTYSAQTSPTLIDLIRLPTKTHLRSTPNTDPTIRLLVVHQIP